MKQILAIFLICALCMGLLAGCGGEKQAEATAPTTEPERDYSEFAGIVEDTKTWYDELMAMPIANENMTEDELRQLAVDAFRINLSFTWTPTRDITYDFTLLERTTPVSLPAGSAYAGMFYNNNNARGNIWKVLQYYDPETGAVDMEELGSNHFMVLSSACSYGFLQAWNRVSNSHGLTGMDSYNKGYANIVTVGPYDYNYYEHSFGHGDGTARIIEKNGIQTMCESYAAMKPADGLYSSTSYHVTMCSATPVVVRLPDGTIDPNGSYMLINEQSTGGALDEKLHYAQGNGVNMCPLGTVDKKYTFLTLLEKNYVPFTCKEFLGEDPVEPGKAWIGTQTTTVESGKDITATEIFSNQIWGNYNVCTAEVQVKDPNGQVLLSHCPAPTTTPEGFSMAFGSEVSQLNLQPLANGSNTIHIYARLSNGELLEAFQTVLKVG